MIDLSSNNFRRTLLNCAEMLQNEARENILSAGKLKKEKEQPVLKTDTGRIENYSNLIYQISSELGFILPDTKHEHEPFKQKYQPSLKYRGTNWSIR